MRDFIQLNKLKNGLKNRGKDLYIVLLFDFFSVFWKRTKKCMEKNYFLIDLEIKTKMYAKLYF